MTHLWRLFSAFCAAHGARLALGATLAILATLMGAALLGLSGWFVAGAALSGAGLAVKTSSLTGASWVLRILALGRTASRYGERLATHDATLRFLSDVRGRLYRGLAEGPWRMLGRLRRGEALSRLTADVDALDGFYLRLLLPIATASIALTIGFAALWRFAGPAVAFATLAPLAVAGGLCLKLGVRRGGRAARCRLAALDALRLRTIDLMSATPEYAAAGRLDAQRAAIAHAADRAAQAENALRKLDSTLGALVSFAGDFSIAAGVAAALLASGSGAPAAAIAALAAFGLLETIQPLRRGAIEYGGLAHAARRIAPQLSDGDAPRQASGTDRHGPLTLSFEAVGFAYAPDRAAVLDDFNLTLGAGEIVALEGQSGSGKSTALTLAAGMTEPTSGVVHLGDRAILEWPEPDLRAAVAYLPQRTELLGETLAEALRLGAPDADDAALWDVLEVVEMADAARAAGGLEAQLGAGGIGFSGGETRRIALARLLLRSPAVVLLDEPTEGLGTDQAARILKRVLDRLSNAAVLIASHSAEERARADRIVKF